MSNKFFNPRESTSLNQGFRERRFAFFKKLLGKLPADKKIQILDVGGTQSYWERMKFTDFGNVHITLLNLGITPVTNENFTSVVGDARSMKEYSDNYFDIAYSNSVIEHLFTAENQQKMANEVRRVSKNYYIQTPNYYFPFEPHWLFPLFQYFPRSMKIWMTRHFSLGHHPKEADPQKAAERVDEVRLLTEKQMKDLFPDGNVYREKLAGLTKSITMYKF